MMSDKKKGLLRIAALLLAASLLGGQALCLSPRAEGTRNREDSEAPATPSAASRSGGKATGSDAAEAAEDPSIDPETGYIEDGEVIFDLATGTDAHKMMSFAASPAPLLRDGGSGFTIERFLMGDDEGYNSDPSFDPESVTYTGEDWVFINDQQGYVLDKYKYEYRSEDGTDNTQWSEYKYVQAGDVLPAQVLLSVVTLQIYYKTLNKPSFQGHGMKLTDKIGVRFKIKVPEGFDPSGAQMEFEMTDSYRQSKISYSDGEPADGETDAKWFTLYINALELFDEIRVTFRYGDGKNVSQTYSAFRYIEDARKFYPGKNNLNKLLDALQNYGYYMRKSGWTDGKSHRDIKEIEAIGPISGIGDGDVENVGNDVKNEAAEIVLGDSGIDTILFSLTLNSDTQINAFFKPMQGVSITKPGGKQKMINGEAYYQFDSERINVLKLGTPVKISVTTRQGTASLTASALTYVNAVLNKSTLDKNKKYAMTAYYKYYKAAEDYSDAPDT